MWLSVRTCSNQACWLEEKKSGHVQCWLYFTVAEMTSSTSFARIIVYFGITLTFLTQSSGSPLLADHYRGTFNNMTVNLIFSNCFWSREIYLLTTQIVTGFFVKYSDCQEVFPVPANCFVLTNYCWWRCNRYYNVRPKLGCFFLPCSLYLDRMGITAT